MRRTILLMNLGVVAILAGLGFVLNHLPTLFLFGILVGIFYCSAVAYLEYGVVLGKKWMEGPNYRGPDFTERSD